MKRRNSETKGGVTRESKEQGKYKESKNLEATNEMAEKEEQSKSEQEQGVKGNPRDKVESKK